ncbi:PREDICTED: formin-like protein 11 [Tarenaya hassleriana]|uniref:formin-like protein 11 n=1 Tax=Tarenaya hassleriana TaxID=28532 RepID=UPI00053C8866|nr:PREDICTED: formin-like protein 11 [Tarenaya hassleriana]
MDYFRQMILMVIVVVISLQCCRVSYLGFAIVADAEELGEWRLLMAESSERDGTLLSNVAGEDETEKKELLIVEKFRALLDLIKPSTSPPRNPAKSEPLSPWPAPVPSPSPGGGSGEPPAYAPAPLQPIPPHFRRPLPKPSHRWRQHEFQKPKREEGIGKKILVPVLIATASAIGFVACVLGLFCLGVKIRKRRNSVTSSFKRRKGKSQNSSTRKVSVNPTLDFLYLNSTGVDLERQCSDSVKETRGAEKGLSYNNGGLLEEEVKKRETEISPDSDNASSSSTKEIVSVHENDEQAVDSVSGFVVVPPESDSSDNESFHSFCASQSSRLSNASANIAIESSEHFPEDEREIQESGRKDSGIAPPPPPPLPPPSRLPFSNRWRHSFSLPRPNLPALLPDLSEKASDSSSMTNLQTLMPPPSKNDSSPSTSTNLQTRLPDLSEKAPETSSSANLQAPPCPPPPPPPRPLPLAGSKPPPPPPLSLNFSQREPLGKDGGPLPKLKPLHWDKVRATPDRSMVWDKIRTSSFELDEEMIESLFGYTMQCSMKNEEGKSKTPSPGKHLLEPKRLQNVTILLKALNASTEHICSALVKGEGLCLQQLEALVRMVPTKEEESKLCSYRGAIDELGSAEKFIRAMLGVPFSFQRAEAMLYRETFEDEVVHLRNSFTMLEEACKELKSSRLFLKLLEAVLKTGNRMNVGTIRGGAKAFKLDALLKLSDVKGTDGKTTLLHFVVQEISRSEGIRVSDSIMGRIMNQRTNKNRTKEEKEEDYKRMGLDLVSGLNTELQNVKKTATIDLDVLTSSVSNLRDGLSKLRSLAHEKLSGEDESDKTFVGSMSLFLRHAEKSVEELREDEKRVMERVREITEYFHGDVRGDDKNPLRIFVVVRDFLGMLDHVCRELRSVRVPSSPNPLAPFR